MTATSAPDTLKQHRQNFPSLANKAYFNFGGQGPMPRMALDAIYKAYEYAQNQGPFSGQVKNWLMQESALTREALARELGTRAANITLTENVTVGCNIALWGIDWQEGDRILITDCEHPGVIGAVKEIARRFKVKVTTCPIAATLNRGNPAVVIEQHLHPDTRLFIASHLLWNTGQVLPLEEIVEICRNYQSNRPLQILVDAAQSVGCLPLNLDELGVDFYAFTGHKWMCGPAGVGGLYVRKEARETLNPTFIGWRGVVVDTSTGMPTDWHSDGRKFEVATSAYQQYVGLRAALAVHHKWGDAEMRYEKIRQNGQYLWQGLSILPNINCVRNSPPEAGIVSFQFKENIGHKQLVQALEQQGFFLRTIASPDCIRACVHYFTQPSEMDQLIKVLEGLRS
ncbi:MAG: aminotransferase class V-fold PLP-dependent enzyme [Cyanobacteria bacterium SBLK]|nr:aminotransferase class V-fold PLP-dependent enzyme [Cyanobacteria bacterium SBLK]